MADNVVVSAGTGTTVAADEVTDGTLGSCKVQYVKLMDGTLDGTTKATVGAGGLAVDLGSNNDVTITGDALTALQLIDNAISGAGFNITQFAGAAVPIGAGLEATALRVTIATDSTGVISIDDNGGAITVDGAVTVTNATAANLKAEVTVAAAQTLATVTTVGTVTTCSTLTGGGIAHDSADSGNPHKIGAKATASVLGATPVAAADRTDLFAGLDGVLFVRPYGSDEDSISDRATNTDGTSTAFTGAMAATASQRIYVTDIALCNSSASNVTVDIRDGAAGSVLWTLSVPAGGGNNFHFIKPLRFTANTAVAFDPSAAASTITCSVNGYKSKQ